MFNYWDRPRLRVPSWWHVTQYNIGRKHTLTLFRPPPCTTTQKTVTSYAQLVYEWELAWGFLTDLFIESGNTGSDGELGRHVTGDGIVAAVLFTSFYSLLGVLTQIYLHIINPFSSVALFCRCWFKTMGIQPDISPLFMAGVVDGNSNVPSGYRKKRFIYQ